MRLAAAALAVAAWCLTTPSNAHAVSTTIDFDRVGQSGDVLTTQYEQAGVTFDNDFTGDPPVCRTSALMLSGTARSPERSITPACPNTRIIPAIRISGRLSVGQQFVSVWVRIDNPGDYTDTADVTLRAHRAGEPDLAATGEATNGEWMPLRVYAPANTITSFEIGYDDPLDQFPLKVDDLSFSRDETPPTININTPSEGAVYAQGEGVRASYGCYDGESGLADPGGCVGTSANGAAVDTETLGDHEFKVTALDNAGNPATKTVKYKVVSTTLSLAPTCAASGEGGTYTITVTGMGLDPARSGVLRFWTRTGERLFETTTPIKPAADGTFTELFEPPRLLDGFYTVSFHYLIPDESGGGYEGDPPVPGPTIASAIFAVPCPTLEVEPECGPADAGAPGFYTLKVTGRGFPPRGPARILFSGDRLGDTTVDDGGSFVTTITPALRPSGTYDITAIASTRIVGPPFTYLPPQPPPGANFDVTALTTFKVPCDEPPSIHVSPVCGAAGANTIRVLGEHFIPASRVLVRFDDHTVSDARVDANGALDTEISVADAGPLEHTVTVHYPDGDDATDFPGGVPSAAFTVPCHPDEPPPTPAISVAPTCGAAGATAIRVIGHGFTRGHEVDLLFDGRPAGSGVSTSDGTLDATLSVADAQPLLHTVSVRYRGAEGITDPVASATYLVPCPAAVSITPDCGQAQLPSGLVAPYSIQVGGRGFVAPGEASISFDGASMTTVPVAADGTVTAKLEVDAQPSGVYEVRVQQQVRDGEGGITPYIAVASFTVPCGEATVTPGCDVPQAGRAPGERYDLHVHGKTFAPGSKVALTFESVGGVPVALHLATADARGRIVTTFSVPRQRTGTYFVRATILRGGIPTPNFLVSALVVPCTKPTIAVDPPLGRPGFLTTVKGRDFPPNARIHLTWNTGSLGSAHVRTDARGRFRTLMLVFMHDLLGPRVLTARTETGYSQATADYLVVPGSQQPGGFLARR